MTTPAQLAKTLTLHTWVAGGETIVVKNTWNLEFKGRKFVVKKSSFGWHVDEQVGGEYKRHVLGTVVYKNRTDALQDILIQA
jgi:hypothetical protein